MFVFRRSPWAGQTRARRGLACSCTLALSSVGGVPAGTALVKADARVWGLVGSGLLGGGSAYSVVLYGRSIASGLSPGR